MLDDEQFREEYHGYLMKKILFIAALVVLLIIGVGYTCTISGREMTFMEGWEAIINHILGKEFVVNSDEWWDEYIVWNITMPRVLAAIFCGGGLALCGAVMQSLLNNPLAEPYTVGVSSGAVFGACLAIVFGFSMTGIGQYGIVINAFLLGLIPMAAIILLTKFSKNLSPVTMILAGTAISYFFSGLTTVMLVTTDEETLGNAYRWQIGSLEGIYWENIWLIVVAVTITSLILLSLSKYLNAISMGNRTATSLGINIDNVRTVALLATTLMAAVILSFTGVIGFVGLVAPHIVRKVIGGDNTFVLPASILVGSTTLLLADALSRFLTDIDIPVGAVMMMLGAPIFIYLMIGRKNRGVIY